LISPLDEFRVSSGRYRVSKSARGDLSETNTGIPVIQAEESEMSTGSLLLKMELRSKPEMLGVVRQALAQLATVFGFSEADCRAVVLAVDEALANIIRHAYLGNTEKPIKVAFYRVQAARNGHREQALEIVLEDEGKAVNRKKLCGRPLEDLRPGGLGLHFIRECMDSVEFHRKIGRNQLRLVKILDARPAEKNT
jgi:serine/threonine-protein kinase RsbW